MTEIPGARVDASKSVAETTTWLAQARSKDEVALDLMKFIAVTTGYGKGAPSAGFSGKSGKTPEEYAEALLQLFERCRTIVGKPVGG